jgi:Flp pilus assembly protein TadB
VDTKIVVALIAAGAVVTQVVVTYLVNRQSANDLRTNIAREIDIIRKLSPDSGEVTKLDGHVRKSINDLIARDERRDRTSEIIWTVGPLQVTGFAIYGLSVWIQHGLPKDLRVLILALFWALVVICGVLGLRFYWQVLRFLYLIIYTRVLRVKTWRLERKLAKTKREMEELKPKVVAVVEYGRALGEFLTSHKDEIIETTGQEGWDEVMGLHAEVDRAAMEAASLVKAREAAPAEPEEASDQDPQGQPSRAAD